MGPDADEMAVVDERLRVRGLSGLRVVDASIFPTLPSVNPMILVLTVAERAADMIKEDSLRLTPLDQDGLFSDVYAAQQHWTGT